MIGGFYSFVSDTLAQSASVTDDVTHRSFPRPLLRVNPNSELLVVQAFRRERESLIEPTPRKPDVLFFGSVS